METSPKDAKRRKDVVQSECSVSEEGFADALRNSEPNANWGAEPNFNLNLNLTSPRNPRLASDTARLQQHKKDARGSTSPNTRTASASASATASGEGGEPLRPKSKIPALCHSTTTEPRLKSPNPKRTPTTSPKTPNNNNNMAASPKPDRVEPATTTSSPRTTERVSQQRPGVPNPRPHKTDVTSKTANKATASLKTQSSRKEDGGKETNLESESPRTLHLPVSPRGESRVISPKLADRTPKQKPEQTSAATPPAGPTEQHQRAEMTPTPQTTTPSPKPSSQRTHYRNSTKENLHHKDSSVGSGSRSSSNSKATTPTADSLDLKPGSDPKTSPNSTTRSKDSLDSRGSSVSKTSWGSKDSLDSKTGLTSKPSPNCKTGTGSRDKLESKSGAEIKAGKITTDSKVVVGSHHGIRSKDNLDPEAQSPSESQVLSSSSGKPSPDPKSGSDSPEPGTVRSGSKSPTLMPSPGPGSGSGPGKTLGVGSAGPKMETQKSPGSLSVSDPSAPLAASTPKTRTTVALTMRGGSGSDAVKTDPSTAPHNTALTRGLTYDSITRTSVKTADKPEHLKPPEAEGGPVGGPGESQCGGDMTDNALPPSPPTHPGDPNAISTRGNVPSSRATRGEDKKGERKRGKHGDGLGSSSSKSVREVATMTDPGEGPGLWGGERKEVGVQVEVEVEERSASTTSHLYTPASFLIGSPGGSTSPSVPSLSKPPLSKPPPPPLQHVCKIDIELRSQPAVPDKASSLPACLRTFSFQQAATLTSDQQPTQNQDRDVSAESIWEDQEDEEEGDNEEKEDTEEMGRPQEVAWDKQGMTWEVYGAAVDLECLGTAIQSHLESKIREQEKHITSLRKSIGSNSSLKGYRMKRRKRSILGCCRKAPAVAD